MIWDLLNKSAYRRQHLKIRRRLGFGWVVGQQHLQLIKSLFPMRHSLDWFCSWRAAVAVNHFTLRPYSIETKRPCANRGVPLPGGASATGYSICWNTIILYCLTGISLCSVYGRNDANKEAYYGRACRSWWWALTLKQQSGTCGGRARHGPDTIAQ